VNDRPVPLILSQHELSFNERGPRAEPGRALVYATRDGRAEVRSRRVLPGASGIAFHRVYVVDVADQEGTLKDELPSREVPFQFQVELQVGWRVTDPVRVVDRRIADGTSIVRSRLLDRLRPIGARFSLEDSVRAESQINETFARGVSLKNEGITVHYLSARVYLDQPTIEYLEERRRKRRDHELESMDQAHEEELRARRGAAIQAAVHGEADLLLRHLADNPGDGMTVVRHLAERREMAAQAKRELFDKMLAEGFIQEADVDPLREVLLRADPGFPVAGDPVSAAQDQVLGIPVQRPAAPAAAAPPPFSPPVAPQEPAGDVYYDVRAEPVDPAGAEPPYLTLVNGVVTWTKPHPHRGGSQRR
jgi:hypothetical protein